MSGRSDATRQPLRHEEELIVNEAKYVTAVTVKDPDTGGDVSVEIWKHPGGGLFGVDSSYLDQVSTVIQDPFSDEPGSKIELPTP